MRVFVFPADLGGCGYYRLIWPAKILLEQGHDIIFVPPGKDVGFPTNVTTLADGSQRITKVMVPEADMVVLQRPAHELQEQLVNILRANGIAVVFDIDDDMDSIHPANAAYHLYRPGSMTPLSWRIAKDACNAATFVTTSTPALQKIYARHGRGMVLDNYVPEMFLRFEKERMGFFGWAGTVKNHPNDPQVASAAVRKLTDEGFRFKVVGPDDNLRSTFRLNQTPEFTGVVQFNEWARTLADSLDVGIAPLAMTTFNTSKSRLKAIEYMSLGIPWVGSPRAEYRRLVRESGCGFLADTTKQWYTMVKRLLTDESLYAEQSEAGRSYMMTQTYEANAWRWAEAWQRAYDIQRGHRS